MSSLEPENTVFTVADGSSLGSRLSRIEADEITVGDLTITGTINGTAVSGDIVFTDSVQTLTNKTLIDDNTIIANSLDPTVAIAFEALGATGTTAALQFLQTDDRVYTFPDPGIDADVLLTVGDQSINGELSIASSLILRPFVAGTQTAFQHISGGSTVGATTVTIYTFATSTDELYFHTVNLVAATSAGDTAVFTSQVKAKNAAGVVTIGTPFNNWEDIDAAIATASISFSVSGTNILLRATGVAATTIEWSGFSTTASIPF